MKNVNLIPAPRRDAKRRRRNRKACTVACAAYAVVLAGAVGGAHVMYGGVAETLDERLAATGSEITRLERQADETRSELASSRATIEANRTVAEQPDWSVVLAMLAQATGKDVVLRSVTIAPSVTGTSPTPAAASKAAADVALEVQGIGRSQLAVSQHVLRLEQTGLFSKVTLLDTGRESYLNANSIAFRIQCVFGERPAPAPIAAPVKQPAVTSLDTGGIRR